MKMPLKMYVIEVPGGEKKIMSLKSIKKRMTKHFWYLSKNKLTDSRS